MPQHVPPNVVSFGIGGRCLRQIASIVEIVVVETAGAGKLFKKLSKDEYSILRDGKRNGQNSCSYHCSTGAVVVEKAVVVTRVWIAVAAFSSNFIE
jgi:hypothetical protein